VGGWVALLRNLPVFVHLWRIPSYGSSRERLCLSLSLSVEVSLSMSLCVSVCVCISLSVCISVSVSAKLNAPSLGMTEYIVLAPDIDMIPALPRLHMPSPDQPPIRPRDWRGQRAHDRLRTIDENN
jgi:hypothetical protein